MHVEARNNLTAANKRGGKMIRSLSLSSLVITRGLHSLLASRARARAHTIKKQRTTVMCKIKGLLKAVKMNG
jgi:hypothetical protein